MKLRSVQAGVVRDFEGDGAAGPGRAGSLLAGLVAAGVEIDHVCGGYAGCGTCRVEVTTGAEGCSPPGADELRRLATLRGRTAATRLACQCVPGAEPVEVVVPEPARAGPEGIAIECPWRPGRGRS